MIDIVEWAESSKAGQGFYVDRHWVDGGWQMRPGPIKLSPHHAAILRHVFTPVDGRWRYSDANICEAAKSGKTALAALSAQYVGMAVPKTGIYMASSKQKQAASLMYKSLVDSIEMNPYLKNKVDVLKTELVFENDTVIRAIPSSARGEAGQRFSLFLVDELWAYVYEDTKRLYSEFKPDPTQPGGSMRLAFGVAGYEDSELWLSLLEAGKAGEPVKELDWIRNPDGTPACWANGETFTYWSHQPRQPWHDARWLARFANMSESEIDRQVYCNFVAPVGKFIEPVMWENCYDPRLKPLQPGDRQSLVVSFDLAEGVQGGDTCALVAMSKLSQDENCVKFVQVWEPPSDGRPFDFDQTIGVTLSWLIKNYHVAEVCYDKYQAINFIRPFERLVFCRPFSQQNERYQADSRLFQSIIGRKIHHYGDPVLDQHVNNAVAKFTGDKMRLTKKNPRSKIDAAVALAMANDRATYLNLDYDPLSREADTRKKTPDELYRQRMKDNEAYLMLKQSHDRKNGVPQAPQANGAVRVVYQGGMSGFTLNTTSGPQSPVRNHVYEVSEEVFKNLQATYPYHWWIRIG